MERSNRLVRLSPLALAGAIVVSAYVNGVHGSSIDIDNSVAVCDDNESSVSPVYDSAAEGYDPLQDPHVLAAIQMRNVEAEIEENKGRMGFSYIQRNVGQATLVCAMVDESGNEELRLTERSLRLAASERLADL